jgi:U32 family peptidase
MTVKSAELLAPAGDLEKLESALYFGADAVYLGGAHFGLRAQANNFTLAELRQGVDLCRAAGKRLYLTLNAFLRPEEYPGLEAYLEELRPLDIDAYIVADAGVLATVRRVDPRRPLHLSTQANTTSAAAVNFWGGQGVTRVNLARELTLADLAAIRNETTLELEIFVHGAMCIAYSGRCLLSAALTGRSANRGACTQPCRWRYALVEETRPGEFFPVGEDERGTYLLNSRDLRLLDLLPALLGAGMDSLKIEGRMKSRYYVAAVTRVYRAALDRYLAEGESFQLDSAWLAELDRVSHRPYDHGLVHGGPDAKVHPGDSHYLRSDDFVGVVLERRGDEALVQGRNRFYPGEELEVIGPAMRQQRFRAETIAATEPEPVEVVQPNSLVRMALPGWVRPGDLLRRTRANARTEGSELRSR